MSVESAIQTTTRLACGHCEREARLPQGFEAIFYPRKEGRVLRVRSKITASITLQNAAARPLVRFGGKTGKGVAQAQPDDAAIVCQATAGQPGIGEGLGVLSLSTVSAEQPDFDPAAALVAAAIWFFFFATYV